MKGSRLSMRFRLIMVSGLLLASAGALAAYRSQLPPSPREQALLLRGEVAELRGEIHACQGSLHWEESEFRALQADVASLQDRITALEALHPDGVPADSYPRYLEVVEAYNESLPGWSERSDAIQSAWEACRDLTERHNTLADSLAQLVKEIMGELPSAAPRPTLDWPERPGPAAEPDSTEF